MACGDGTGAASPFCDPSVVTGGGRIRPGVGAGDARTDDEGSHEGSRPAFGDVAPEASPLVFQLEHDPGEAYPLDTKEDKDAAAAVKAAVKARDAHMREVGALARPQLNRCDAAAFLWADPARRPPSRPYDCYYVD